MQAETSLKQELDVDSPSSIVNVTATTDGMERVMRKDGTFATDTAGFRACSTVEW